MSRDPADPPRASARDRATVAAAFAALATIAVVWLALDRRPPEWDHANHLERAVRCVRYLAAGDVAAVLAQSSFYPPLAICAGGLAGALAPSDRLAAQTAVLAFLGLGMAAVLVLGRMLVGPRAGVVAALLFGSAPFVVYSSVHFQVDLPLAAMVALALVLLVKSEGLQHTGWSAALGIVLGLGMLTKPPFAVYVAPPVVWAVLAARDRRALRNTGLALALGAVVSLPWYGPRLFGMGHQAVARSFEQAAEAGAPDVLTWAGLTFYPAWLPTQLGVAATAAFVVGLVRAIRARRGLLLSALLVPFVMFLVLQNKNLRYTLPLLPVAAVVAALGIEPLRGRVRTVVLAVVVLVGVLQVTATAFGVPPGAELPLLGSPWVLAQPPQRAPWPHRQLLRAVETDSGGRPVTVSIVPNHPSFSVSNFRYYAVRDGLALQARRAWDGHPVGIDYMVLKTGDLGPSWTIRRPQRIAERLRTDPDLARVYPVLVEAPLPDGSTATVRARRVGAADGATPAAVARGLEAGLRAGLDGFARDLQDVTVRIVHDDEIRQGRVERIEITGASALIADYARRDPPRLRVRDFAAVLEDVLVNPHGAAAGRLQLLEVGLVRLDAATIDVADLESVLRAARRAPGAALRTEGGALAVTLTGRGPDVSARVRVRPSADGAVALAFEDVRVAGLRVPDTIVRWAAAQLDPTPRLQERWGVATRIGPVSIADGAVRIGAGVAGAPR
jgi:hypothetical protein